MKYKAVQSENTIGIPREPIMNNLLEADAVQMKVLICIMDKPDITTEELCEKLGVKNVRFIPVYSSEMLSARIFTAIARLAMEG